jgi:hypothetical protein
MGDAAIIEVKREAGLVAGRASFWRGNRWFRWVAGGVLLALVAVGAIVAVLLHRIEPMLRASIVAELERRFHARVELDSFQVSLASGLWAEGKGLRIWPPADHPKDQDLSSGTPADRPGDESAAAAYHSDKPLIQIDEFRFHAPIHFEPGKPIHIPVVELKGLNVDLPPRTHFSHGSRGAGALNPGHPLPGFRVDSIICDGAHLTMETSKPGKQPLEFPIAQLRLTSISESGAMEFAATLTNPRPVGTINSTGNFGPWVVADPGESAVAGDYRFENADLGGFKGIAGILHSTGHYEGTLRDVTVDGQTETPDFRLEPFDKPLLLTTKFHAKVDATNGDTWLNPVDAMLGRSHFTATGQVVRLPAAGGGSQAPAPYEFGGRDIALKIDVDRGRIEDFLHLMSHTGTPMLTGALTVNANLHIPPGQEAVYKRLSVKGSFSLDEAEFSSTKVQGRIRQLSLRGLGRPGELKSADPKQVSSSMRGDFQMAGGVVTLPALSYTVPGALIQLKGAYGVEGGTLKFTGTAKMQATVSEMVGGWKGLLLSPLDHYLKKDGAGTEIPIHINGTREDPEFGIDFSRLRGNKSTQPDTKPQDEQTGEQPAANGPQ